MSARTRQSQFFESLQFPKRFAELLRTFVSKIARCPIAQSEQESEAKEKKEEEEDLSMKSLT
jgi:hypothetical protein